jgi:cytochrome b
MTTDSTTVWDPLVRVLHWALVAAFAISWVSAEDEWIPLHVLAGYVVLGLVLLRLLWGFVGPVHARFSSFVRTPAAVKDYLKQAVLLRPPRYLGHNPAGGAMVVALLATLLLTTASGLALHGASLQAGPLAQWMTGATWLHADWLEEAHEALADLCVILVLFHIAGVILDSFLHRENLVRAMVTGKKEKS